LAPRAGLEPATNWL